MTLDDLAKEMIAKASIEDATNRLAYSELATKQNVKRICEGYLNICEEFQRSKGKTYLEIAEMNGVTRQAIQFRLKAFFEDGNFDNEYRALRRNLKTIKRAVKSLQNLITKMDAILDLRYEAQADE